jgi:hypothetical protein
MENEGTPSDGTKVWIYHVTNRPDYELVTLARPSPEEPGRSAAR